MSRNIRQNYPSTPVKATKRRGSDTTSSSLNLSDDDEHGYSGVDAVSESEDDDEEVVTAAEERHILEASFPRPLELDDGDNNEAEEDNEYEAEDDEVADDNASWDGILSEQDSTATERAPPHIDQELSNAERRVRFTGVPDSDSDSTTSETSEDFEGFFPDIFVDQSTLDPAFRREIENDHDDSSSNSGSYWDFHNGPQDVHAPSSEDEDELTPIATPMASGAPTEVSTPTPTGEGQELDGYETDGDTTEEDEPEPPVRRKQMRRFPLSEPDTDSDSEKPTPFRRGKPRVGRYNLDKSEKKPIAVLNPSTRKMMIFTPQRVSRLDLSPESFNVDFSQADLPSSCLPILNPGYVMMGAMLSSSTFGDLINTQPFGPAEAFFPLTSDPPLDDYSEESEFAPPEEDEGESQLKIEDFVTFHGESSDDEEESGVDWNGDLASSPTRPRTAASGASATTDSSAHEVHPLFSHFDNNSDAVGAFRRNQINQQLIFSDKASHESLAFSGPYHYGTLRGIKSGSMETVTTPITPVRRRRSNTIGVQGFELQGSPQQKRKASSNFTDSLHKKQRSISDMDYLQI